MYLTKDGITIDVVHPVEIKHFKSLGYREVKTPEELNAEAIQAVNESKGTPSTELKAPEKEGEK